MPTLRFGLFLKLFYKIICYCEILRYLCINKKTLNNMKQHTLIFALCAAAIFAAIFTLPLLVCEFIHYGVKFLSSL